MSHITVQLTETSTRFHIHETKPWGVPDSDRIVEMSPDRQHDVPPLPPLNEHGNRYKETSLFWIAERQQWIGFDLFSCWEASAGPNEENYYGPFATREPAPRDGSIIERRMVRVP
ncbi:MAG: hypothetical protein HY326_05085 [Chloroflexi bacterium]|nr:hypothetical protein [Chloroflexota bacterium]